MQDKEQKLGIVRSRAASLVLALVAAILIVPAPAGASSIQHINNGALRFGGNNNDSTVRLGGDTLASVGGNGLLRQPFYWNGSKWRKLTYNNYPLDMAIGYGTSTSGHWNGNAVTDLVDVTGAVVDYSGLNPSGSSTTSGFGQVITQLTTTLSSGVVVQVENKYDLGESNTYIRIETKVTNNSNTVMSSSGIWVGTRDDYVGGDDSITKSRGVVDSSGFTKLTQSTQASNAIQITSQDEGVLFYTTTPSSSTIIQSCCQFSNVYNQNPASSSIEIPDADGSYGVYFPLGNLAPSASTTVVWFYAAGSIADLSNVISQVAAAGAAEQGLSNPTSEGGTLDYSFTYPGTASYVVVDRGSPAPTSAQVVAGADFVSSSSTISIAASGSAVLGAGNTTSFVITGLSQAKQYTVYTVTEYDEGPSGSPSYTTSAPEPFDFNTLAAAPTVGSITPGSGEVSVAITAPIGTSNFEYTINGGSSWVARSPASTASPWVISGLTNGTTYTFSFRAVYEAVGGVSSSILTATPAALPGLPRSLSAVFGFQTGATISWQAPASDGGASISGYVVEYNSGSGWQTVTASGRTAYVSDVWLNQNWSFRVAAENANGIGSSASYTHSAPAPATVSPPAGPPSLVNDNNRNSISATPGRSVAGTVSGGTVSPIASTVSRVTASAVEDIRTQAQDIVTTFNSRWRATISATPPITSVETSNGALIYGLMANSTTNEPLGIPAEDVLLVTTENNEAVLLAARNSNGQAKVNAEGALVVAQGSTIAVAAHGLDPNTPGELVLLSDPTLLGTFTTDPNGSFVGQVTLPPGIAPGNHTAVLITPTLVTSLGLALLAPTSNNAAPRPYEGPLGLEMQQGPFCSGAKVKITGQRLNTIQQILVGTTEVPLELTETGDIFFNLRDMAAGSYKLSLVVPISGLVLTSQIIVNDCQTPTIDETVSPSFKVNVGSFNGKLVVYVSNLQGSNISWKVGGRWGKATATSNFARFDRPTPRRGVTVNVQLFVNGKLGLTKAVRTR
jgi:Fibronectin type III domain